jgi:hypothetical protein
LAVGEAEGRGAVRSIDIEGGLAEGMAQRLGHTHAHPMTVPLRGVRWMSEGGLVLSNVECGVEWPSVGGRLLGRLCGWMRGGREGG